MFDRTQSIFHSSLTQVDLFASARAGNQLVTAELAQAIPAYQTYGTNFYTGAIVDPGLVQTLPDTTRVTNALQEFFFLTRQTEWKCVAYLVVASSTNANDVNLFNNGVGTLVRYETTVSNINVFDPNTALSNYLTTLTPNFQRVADGVVDFKIKGYDASGLLITNMTGFTNNLIPASIDLEFGILEPEVVRQARAFPTQLGSSNFLSNPNLGTRMHIFNTHIPIRTATQ
jgi:hypothetical protein